MEKGNGNKNDFIYNIFEKKTAEAEKKLEYNCLFQIFIVVLSLCYIFEKIEYLSIISNKFSIDNIGVLEIIFPILLLYLFVRFGYYLSYFYINRELIDSLYKTSVKNHVGKYKIEDTAFRPYFFEFYYQLNIMNRNKKIENDKGKKNKLKKIFYNIINCPFYIFFLFITIIFALNHSLTLYFICVYFDNSVFRIISLLIFFPVLLFCYIQFGVAHKTWSTLFHIIFTLGFCVIFSIVLLRPQSFNSINRLMGNYNFQSVDKNIQTSVSQSAIETIIKVNIEKERIYDKILDWININYSNKYDKINNENKNKGIIEGFGHSIINIKTKSKLKTELEVHYKYEFKIKDGRFKLILYLDEVNNNQYIFNTIPKEIINGIKTNENMEIKTDEKSIIVFEKAIEEKNFVKDLKLFIEDKEW